MDTTSHIVIGNGLAALAQIDPAVSGSAAMSQAVLLILGTSIASNAPDFDFVYTLSFPPLFRCHVCVNGFSNKSFLF
ncbi:metal-dependent hydrolase [Cytobacillus spongiae]|uniref:metal-dependent hydrolase n=1 Tax=Cytobacillus spongiae TaxID=2901381 RepID=UPI001F21465C|nr:metal-dependent hydrolase [Cytobacillus spongiae]UII54544.1 metal-dependent hydrolase [Cytobacillus spongiae]